MDVNYGRLIRLREDAKEKGEPILRDKSFELLISTVKARRPAKILEIGVNVGLSGIGMLLASGNSLLTGIEIDEEKVKTAKDNYKAFGLENRAKIFTGDASEILPVIIKMDLFFAIFFWYGVAVQFREKVGNGLPGLYLVSDQLYKILISPQNTALLVYQEIRKLKLRRKPALDRTVIDRGDTADT